MGRLELLASLTREMARSVHPELVLRERLESIRVRLGADLACVMLWDHPEICLISRFGDGPVETGPLDPGLATLLRETPVEAYRRLDREGDLGRQIGASWGFPIGETMCRPVRCGNEPVLGAAFVATSRDENENGYHVAGFGGEDSELFEAAVETVALAVANSRARRILELIEETNRELELAATIQKTLLPGPDPLRSPVQGLNRPARTVSGDFYDYLILPGGRFPFALGDVSGKGMNAALLMSKTASLFRCLAKSIDDPAELLGVINREICETATQGMFVTMVVGVYNSVSGVIRFANAGHEPPLLRRPDRSYRTFPAEAPPIGILDDLALETVETDIAGGEFYIFSDGLTEFAYGEGEMLGVTGLIQMVEGSKTIPLAERLDGVLAALDADGWSAHDDLTALTIDGTWVPRNG